MENRRHNSTIIFDFSLFTKSHALNDNRNFHDLDETLKRRILSQYSNYWRYDIIGDRYLEENVKENSRSFREQG